MFTSLHIQHNAVTVRRISESRGLSLGVNTPLIGQKSLTRQTKHPNLQGPKTLPHPNLEGAKLTPA